MYCSGLLVKAQAASLRAVVTRVSAPKHARHYCWELQALGELVKIAVPPYLPGRKLKFTDLSTAYKHRYTAIRLQASAMYNKMVVGDSSGLELKEAPQSTITLTDLSADLIASIVHRLDPQDVMRWAATNHRARQLLHDDQRVWRGFCVLSFPKTLPELWLSSTGSPSLYR